MRAKEKYMTIWMRIYSGAISSTSASVVNRVNTSRGMVRLMSAMSAAKARQQSCATPMQRRTRSCFPAARFCPVKVATAVSMALVTMVTKL